MSGTDPAVLQQTILAWSEGTRRDLPWRRTRDPWAVLVSEVMLHQTQASRVEAVWPAFLAEFRGAADAVLLYSVIQHEFISGDLWSLFDAVCGLLAGGGRALFGDIPNRSMRTRLFQSPNGRAFHRSFTGKDTEPPVPPYGLAPGEIDDAVVLSLLMRARNQGIHGYVVPQPDGLPFSNRREDVVLHHP